MKVLKSIQDSIEESGMSDDLFNKEDDAKTALLIASRRHEALWAEKAKLRWMKNGDCNSKLFHLSVKMRRARNQISALKREDGIIEHHDLLDCIPKILSNEDVASLEATPSREEIKKAVWDMDPDSSLGPDGFPGKFFRKCWEIVETDFGKAYASFAGLVSDEQGAFQKGKIISSNISLASKLENLMHSAMRGGGMGLKLDVQKAYDSLSWKFLFATLIKFGLSDKWISWIQLLLSSSTLFVLVNGGPEGFFPVGKGLRQGDPISPFLLILAEEVFCRGLKLLVMDGKLKSLPGPRVYWWPDHSIKLVERWMSNFIWSGDMEVTKRIVVNWDDVCKPKQEGGLGIRKLRDVNFACLAKLTWQIKHEESSMRWVKLNSDGCSLGNPGKAGGGGLLCNEKAEVLYNYREFL
ncbi:uncharacterized protein LOC122069718 [Macadamia integrifolia]|uniref:uncharacterized protein LOC122069718 n=1 Tax=Macadamia integrifolia TaxID=60698 RepID=UPI001C4EFFCB|nr:uncharacterized protein LOC122069718 [Macadamia integrifolia]